MTNTKSIQFFVISAFLAVISIFMGITQAKAGEQNKGHKYTLSDVKGRYSFSFKGEIVGVGSVAAVGYIRADGKGNISKAERTISVLGTATTETFTCTYTISPNGKGAAECPLDSPAPGFPSVETFVYVLEENGNAFRMVGTTPGIVVSGGGHK